MDLDFKSMAELGLAECVRLLNRGFEGYVVPLKFDEKSLQAMLGYDGTDLESSRVVLRDGTPVRIAMITRRGLTSRLAAMAIVPEARGEGIGRSLTERLSIYMRPNRVLWVLRGKQRMDWSPCWITLACSLKRSSVPASLTTIGAPVLSTSRRTVRLTANSSSESVSLIMFRATLISRSPGRSTSLGLNRCVTDCWALLGQPT